jgi:DNA-binding transcriptional MerR regulator
VAKSPDAFRTISEVAAQLETPAHVLRFWESKFPQIKPVKRAGGRRYYRPDDIALVAGIKVLLHDQGMTIRGVQKILREKGAKHVATLSALPWEGVDAVEEADEPPEAVAEEASEPAAEVDIEAVADDAAPDPVVVGPWPGAGGEEGPAAKEEAPAEATAPMPARSTVVESFVAGVASRLAAQREMTAPALPEPSLARLREALGAADRARLCAGSARLGPLVSRLRALRHGSSGRPG